MNFFKRFLNFFVEFCIDLFVVYLGFLSVYYIIIPLLPILTTIGLFCLPFIGYFWFRKMVPYTDLDTKFSKK